jgi:acyl dehydratase
MPSALTPQQLEDLVGTELGTSDWLVIDQDRISRFADVTEDHNFIHVDAERAAKTPFGTTIAHGLLTLSLIVRLCADFVPTLANRRLLLNYGFDRVRFPAPVKAGGRIRAVANLSGVERRSDTQFLVTLHVVIEIENEPKPAVVADWLSFHVIE